MKMQLLRCGDIHSNPGPADKNKLSISHWILNSLSVRNFEKLGSIEAFNGVVNHDIICLSETFLDSSFSTDDSNLNLKGYNIIRSDHPNDVRRGSVCVYYKDSLALKVLDLCQLPECLVFEVSHERKKCIFALLYRSPSQNSDEFDEFLLEFENLIDSIYNLNPHLIVILGDFNAKTSSWCANDIDSFEGLKLVNLLLHMGYHN